MEKDFLPLVSIVIPVYRGANFVAEAIDSALAQTYSNIEILVINDGSDDDGATERAVLVYGDKVRYFTKPNGGVSSALNMGIREMHGEYFSWLSHDDLYEPMKIENQINILRERPPEKREIILMCHGCLIDENGKKIPRPSKYTLCGEYTGEKIFCESQKKFRSLLNGLGMLIPKSVLDKVGFFDETLRYIQDYEYWYRIMIAGFSFLCTETENVMGRVHKGQVTARFPELYYTESEIVAKRLFKLFMSDEKYVSFLYSYLCGCAKELNPVTKEVMKQLKSKNECPFRLRMNVLFYSLIGRLKQIYKKIYHLMFLRNER